VKILRRQQSLRWRATLKGLIVMDIKRTGCYIRRNGLVVPATVDEWAESFATDDRIVDETYIRGIRISTVFLGIDYNFSCVGLPILYETMVFGGTLDQRCERYCSETEAKIGHRRWVDRAKTELYGITKAICDNDRKV